MTVLNIHTKIEAKSIITSKGIEFLKNQGLFLNDIYASMNNDRFLLKYKVQKLSKKARRSIN